MASTILTDNTNPAFAEHSDKTSQNYYTRRNVVLPRELPLVDIEPLDYICQPIPRLDFLLSFKTMSKVTKHIIITESEAHDQTLNTHSQSNELPLFEEVPQSPILFKDDCNV